MTWLTVKKIWLLHLFCNGSETALVFMYYSSGTSYKDYHHIPL